MQPLYIAYFTRDTPYEGEAAQLRANLDKFGLPNDIRGVPNMGSWQRNTQFKARFVQSILAEYPGRPCVYLDVDAEVVQTPTLFDDLPCDIAAAKFGGHELLSGTLYLGATPKLNEIVATWVALCEEYPEKFPAGLLNYHPGGGDAWDQRLLQIAINRTAGTHFVELPPAYTFIYDLSKERYPDVSPVIIHWAASRKYRDGINEGAYTK